MKNRARKSNSQKDLELLTVEAFQRARQMLDAFERLTTMVWSLSLEKDEATSEATLSAPKVEERDGVLLCTIKEACKRTGLSRSSIYKAMGSGKLRAKNSASGLSLRSTKFDDGLHRHPPLQTGE